MAEALLAVLAWVAAASVAALVLTLLDKRRARRGAARVPERRLLLLALVGGSPGLVSGMLLARHKTRKAGFLGRLALVLLLQAAAAWWAYTVGGLRA